MIDSPYGIPVILAASALTGLTAFALATTGPNPERASYTLIVGLQSGALIGLILALKYPSKWPGGWG